MVVIQTVAEAAQQGKGNVIIRMMAGRQGGRLLDIDEFVHKAFRLLRVMPIQDITPFFEWFEQSGATKAMHKVPHTSFSNRRLNT